MNNYSLEELLPIVYELTQKYTCKESSSISYEKANQLMEAVLFCINEYENIQPSTYSVQKLCVSAQEAYTQGYRLVLEKIKTAKNNYQNLISVFCD